MSLPTSASRTLTGCWLAPRSDIHVFRILKQKKLKQREIGAAA